MLILEMLLLRTHLSPVPCPPMGARLELTHLHGRRSKVRVAVCIVNVAITVTATHISFPDARPTSHRTLGEKKEFLFSTFCLADDFIT